MRFIIPTATADCPFAVTNPESLPSKITTIEVYMCVFLKAYKLPTRFILRDASDSQTDRRTDGQTRVDVTGMWDGILLGYFQYPNSCDDRSGERNISFHIFIKGRLVMFYLLFILWLSPRMDAAILRSGRNNLYFGCWHNSLGWSCKAWTQISPSWLLLPDLKRQTVRL